MPTDLLFTTTAAVFHLTFLVRYLAELSPVAAVRFGSRGFVVISVAHFEMLVPVKHSGRINPDESRN